MMKYRVVFHLDEEAKSRVDLVFANIENLIAELGEGNVEIELVANSKGINALLKGSNQHAPQIGRLVAKRVRFVACANTLRQAGLTKEALLDSVELVPSGVGELVKKEEQGWAYIRP